jgi:HD-GYP domain-containing protein (c-di-GMP phosphodiesterase class II)
LDAPTARLERSTHERFAGTGYPDRRAGEDIPLGVHIIAACDAYTAMHSTYRRKASHAPSTSTATKEPQGRPRAPTSLARTAAPRL